MNVRSCLVVSVLSLIAAAACGGTADSSGRDAGATSSDGGGLALEAGGRDAAQAEGGDGGTNPGNSSSGGNVDSGSQGQGDAGCPSSAPTGSEPCSPGQPACDYNLPGNCSFSCQCTAAGVWMCGGC
jgi:hypothetical protein